MKLGLLENSVNLAAVLKSFSKGHESGAVDRAICSTAQPLKNRARNFIQSQSGLPRLTPQCYPLIITVIVLWTVTFKLYQFVAGSLKTVNMTKLSNNCVCMYIYVYIHTLKYISVIFLPRQERGKKEKDRLWFLLFFLLPQSSLTYGRCDKVPFGEHCLTHLRARSDSADSSGSLTLAVIQSFWCYKDKPFENM